MTNICVDLLTVCLCRTSFLHMATMKRLLWNLHIWVLPIMLRLGWPSAQICVKVIGTLAQRGFSDCRCKSEYRGFRSYMRLQVKLGMGGLQMAQWAVGNTEVFATFSYTRYVVLKYILKL